MSVLNVLKKVRERLSDRLNWTDTYYVIVRDDRVCRTCLNGAFGISHEQTKRWGLSKVELHALNNLWEGEESEEARRLVTLAIRKLASFRDYTNDGECDSLSPINYWNRKVSHAEILSLLDEVICREEEKLKLEVIENVHELQLV